MSGLHLVTMPKWGLSMEEGLVVGWHKQIGDAVTAGDELIDVETTKITNTIEAPATGILRRIVAATGVTAACGTPLAVIGPVAAGEAEIDLFLASQGEQEAQAAAAEHAKAEPVVHAVPGDGEPTRIRYLDSGSGVETLLLIHGFGGDLENWMFNQPALAATMRVIAIDLPGHGGSEKLVGDGSAEAMAHVIDRLLDDIVAGPVHLVAHSFGALVARALAIARPERIASMAAIAPADLGTVEPAYIDGFLNARRRSEMTAAIGLLFANPALATRDMAEALLRYKRLDGVNHGLRAIADANFAAAGPAEVASVFWGDLGKRGLIIWGAQDSVIPLASAANSTADLATVVVEGAGHMPHLEQADQVNTLLARHIADNPSIRDGGSK